jgi:hypothetical protein
MGTARRAQSNLAQFPTLSIMLKDNLANLVNPMRLWQTATELLAPANGAERASRGTRDRAPTFTIAPGHYFLRQPS